MASIRKRTWKTASGEPQTAWAVGQSATSGVGPILLVTHDGGATWDPRAAPVVMGLVAIQFVDASHGWAVGDGGEIIATSDGGETWRVQESAARDFKPWLVDVSFVKKTPLLSLAALRKHAELADMRVLAKGNRLSITPVTDAEWRFITEALV